MKKNLAPAQYLGVIIKTVKIAHVEVALRSLSQCLQVNSSQVFSSPRCEGRPDLTSRAS